VDIKKRQIELVSQEILNPEEWLFLAFINDEDGKNYFKGGCIVRAHGLITAVRKSYELHLNPAANGIECAVECSEPIIPGWNNPFWANRLLNLNEFNQAQQEP
jgi:hypothetical protein